MKLNLKKLVKQSNTYKEFIDTVDSLVEGNPRERSFYTEQIVGPHIETSPKYLYHDPKYYNFGTDNIPQHLQDRISYLQNVNNTTETSDGCVHFRASNRLGSLSKKTRNVRDKDKATSGKLIISEARDMLEEGFDFHIHSSSDEFMSSKKEAQRKINKLGSQLIWMPDSEIESNWQRIQRYILTKKKEMPNPITWRPDEGGPNGSSLEHMRAEGERVFKEKNVFFKAGEFNTIWKNLWDWDTAVGKTTPIVLGLINDFKNCYPYTGQQSFVGEIINPRNAALRNNIIPCMEHFYTMGIKVRHFVFAGPKLNSIKDAMDSPEDGVTLNDLPVDRYDNEKTFRRELKKALNNSENVIIHRNWHTNDKMKKILSSLDVKSFVHIDEVHWCTSSPKKKSGMLNCDSYPMWAKEGYTGTKRGKFDEGVKSETTKKIIKKHFDYGLDNETVHGKTRSVIGLELAVKLGYKHDFRMYIPQYTTAQMIEWFGDDWKENCAKNNYVKPMNSQNNIVMTPDDFIYFHNLLSCMNQGLVHHGIIKCQDIKHGRNTKNELDANLKTLLKAIPNSGKLKPLHTFVADTHNLKKDKIWSHINGIPKNHDLSLTFFADLLGESWSPKDGWVDGTGFLTNIRSYIKVSQTKGRGDRKDGKNQLPFKKEFNRLFLPGFMVSDDPEWNEKYFYQDVKHIIESMHFKDHNDLYEKIIVLSYNKPTKSSRKKRKTTVTNSQPVATQQFNLRKLAKAIEDSWIKTRLLEKQTNELFDELWPHKEKMSTQDYRIGKMKTVISNKILKLTKKFPKVFDSYQMTKMSTRGIEARKAKVERIMQGDSQWLTSDNIRRNQLWEEENNDKGLYLQLLTIVDRLCDRLIKDNSLIPFGSYSDRPTYFYSIEQESIEKLFKKYGFTSYYGQEKNFFNGTTGQLIEWNNSEKQTFIDVKNKVDHLHQIQSKNRQNYFTALHKYLTKLFACAPSMGSTEFQNLPGNLDLKKTYNVPQHTHLSNVKQWCKNNVRTIVKNMLANTATLCRNYWKDLGSWNGDADSCWVKTVNDYKKANPSLKHLKFNDTMRKNRANYCVVRTDGRPKDLKKLPTPLTETEYKMLLATSNGKRKSNGLKCTPIGQSIYYDNQIFTSMQMIIKNRSKLKPLLYRDNKKKMMQKLGFTGDAIKRYIKNSNGKQMRYATEKDWKKYPTFKVA
jgi:hypothetical protein